MSEGAILELTHDTFDARIAEGIVLVDFWAPWCGPCMMQGPILERIASKVGAKARIAKLNVEEAPSLAQRFQITGIPAIKIFKDGKLVSNFIGLQREETLLAALENAA